MLAFYTATCVGLIWSEASTAALFLDRYGAELLPWIYCWCGDGFSIGCFVLMAGNMVAPAVVNSGDRPVDGNPVIRAAFRVRYNLRGWLNGISAAAVGRSMSRAERTEYVNHGKSTVQYQGN